MGRGPRWLDSFLGDDTPTPINTVIEKPKRRKLPKPAKRPEPLNKRGKPLMAEPRWKNYPEDD